MTNIILHQDDTDKDRYYLGHIDSTPVYMFLTVDDLRDLYFKVGAELIDREFAEYYEGKENE